jgi:protein O-GlcNAc transferase
MSSIQKLFDHAYAAHQQGLYDEAIKKYKKLLLKKPAHPDGNYLLGTLYAMQGSYNKASTHLQRAAKLLPDSPMVQTNLGLLLKMQGKNKEAESFLRKALRLNPYQPEALNNLAALLITKGHPIEAEELAQRCINQSISSSQYAVIQHANALADQGRSDEAIELLHQSLTKIPDDMLLWDNYLMMLSYSDKQNSQTIYKEHLRWGKLLAQSKSINNHTQNQTIRIGYISADFHNHPVGRLIQPLIENHDREKFTCYLYHNSSTNDEQTKKLQQVSDYWREILSLDNQACQKLIFDDNIDILIDLTGHSAGNRLQLFALRAAPVQATYLGYASTTGLSNIDYMISDNFFDPPSIDDDYTEELLRLDRIAFAFNENKSPPALPLNEHQPFNFGSFNTLRKISKQVIETWAIILKKHPQSHLIIQAKGLSETAMQQRIIASFAVTGIASERISLHGFSNFESYLSLIATCDLILDSWPWNGHMTTLNSLWMGVPVLTMKSNRRAGRMGAAILQQVGLESLIATSIDDYISKAISFSQTHDQSNSLKNALRERLANSPIMDTKGFTKSFEAALEKIPYFH